MKPWKVKRKQGKIFKTEWLGDKGKMKLINSLTTKKYNKKMIQTLKQQNFIDILKVSQKERSSES